MLAAAASGSTSECTLLLEACGDVGERDRDGFTPLLLAAYFGHAEVCELLLERGKANIEETTRLGNTALIIPWAHATIYKAKDQGASIHYRFDGHIKYKLLWQYSW